MTDDVTTSKERRWIVLAEDGNHVTLGRATDPSEAAIGRAFHGLAALALGGWLAVTEGAYYSEGDISVLEVRKLGTPAVPFSSGVARFLARREVARS